MKARTRIIITIISQVIVVKVVLILVGVIGTVVTGVTNTVTIRVYLVTIGDSCTLIIIRL